MPSRVLVAGLGETGSQLVQRLRLSWRVTGVDVSEQAVRELTESQGSSEDVDLHVGDATSGLVLRKAEPEGILAAVACAGSDEVNFEFLRLARHSFEIQNRYALMYKLDWEDRYRKEGIEIVSQDYACASILESRVEQGQKVATGVGLGHGEIVEVQVLLNSSVVGRPLAELHPKRWLVGAIYRDGELIVPHGNTVIEPDDRVLIIGEPDILPSIATLIRSGDSKFPLQYGSHIVTVCTEDVQEVVDETAYLLEATHADKFETITCDGREDRLRALTERCEEAGVSFEASCIANGTIESLAQEAVKKDLGVLILPPEPLPFLSRIGLGRSHTIKIVDEVSSPVLVSRKTFPYNKVMLVLAEIPFPMAAAQLAIDLVRVVGAEFHLGVVHQPELVVGEELWQELQEERRKIENLAGMYRVETQTRTLNGNPIFEVERASKDVDLLVLPYKRGRTAFLTRPDVGLNLIHRAHCSVLVMPN